MRNARFVTAPLIGFSSIAIASCARDTAGPHNEVVANVIVEPAAASLAIGSTLPLQATVLDSEGHALSERTVHWTVEDPSILTVSAAGLVTGVRSGTTLIAASAGGFSAMAEVVVMPAGAASLRIRPDNLGLLPGQSAQLTAETTDGVGNVLAGRPVSWSSNNPAVATVSARGLVTARAVGGAIISAKSDGQEALASVTVSFAPVSSLQVAPDHLTLDAGDSWQLVATALGAGGAQLVDRPVIWTSSRPLVAAVDPDGTVHARSPGSATITATALAASARATVVVR
jgi:uncharacterized protein YjdB